MSLLTNFEGIFNPNKDNRTIEQIQCDKCKQQAYDAFVKLRKMNPENPLYYHRMTIVDGKLAHLKIRYNAYMDWEKNFNELQDDYWYPMKIQVKSREGMVPVKEFMKFDIN